MQVTNGMLTAYVAAHKEVVSAAMSDYSKIATVAEDARRAGIAAALSAALSIEQTEPVKVKALEWSLSYSSDDETAWSAMAIGGVYTVRQITSSSGAWLHRDHAEKRYPSVAEAKAAAQQDYETRILSALVNAQADADVVERLKEALKAAAEELDRISCVPRVTETSDIYDQFERAKLFADRGASTAWATLRSLRPAEVGSALSTSGTGGGE